MQKEVARKTGRTLSLITWVPHLDAEGDRNFDPIGCFELPEYPEIKRHYPPMLKILEFSYENQFFHSFWRR